jgi:hypothetical protein
MNQQSVTLGDAVSDLLLNQCITKVELSKIIKASVVHINQILAEGSSKFFKEQHTARLFRLYKRLKQHEHKIEEYLIAFIPPYHIKQDPRKVL